MQFKKTVYIIECSNCKKVYIGFTQALNNSSFHKSNIKLPENKIKKIYQNTYEYSKVHFKILPTYQTGDYSVLKIKKKNNFADKFKPILNKA